MKTLLMFRRLRDRAGDDAGGGTVLDRGDDHIPTEDDGTPVPGAAAEKTVVTDDEVKKVVGDPEAKTAEETAAAEAAAAAEADKAKTPKKDTRIPLARHEELLGKERERREQLERELANTRQGQQIVATNEKITAAEDTLPKLEADYTKLVADGDVAKAAAVMAEIRKTERSISEAKSTLAIQAAEARAYERVRYDTTVERLEEAYPKLNPDHDDYDAAITAEAVELRDAYVATGKYGRAEAMQKAAKTLLGAATTRQTTAVESDVRVDKEDLAKATAAERAKAAREKAADTIAKQPASMSKVGLDSDKLGGVLDAKAVIKMSQDDFAKLDEKTLARMRGDEIV